MEPKEQSELVLWLKDMRKIALNQAKMYYQPEQGLYYGRAKAFEDVLMYIEKGQAPLLEEDKGLDARICAFCGHHEDETEKDMERCFMCGNYRHFEPNPKFPNPYLQGEVGGLEKGD